MTRSVLLARLRNPKAVEMVSVRLTGHPAAVAAVARALATVTVVTGLSHHVGDSDTAIALDATCYPTQRLGKATTRGGAR
jgi:hypothetical protein